MIFKKKFEQSEGSGVRMVNGSIQFQAIHLNVHCFEVDGVLIDTGATSLQQQFKPFFQQMDVDQIMLTHYHEDHSGCASYLQKEYNLPVYMSEKRLEECTKKAKYPLYRKFFWGSRPAFSAQPINAYFTSRTSKWTVIETPGHTNDHLAFYNETTGQLFSGDLFVSPKTKVVLKEESIPQIISSIEKVLTYNFEELFCNHAGYVKNGKQALKLKLEYLLEISDRIQMMSEEGLSIKEIKQQIFARNYPITRFSLGEWDSQHIISSVLNK
ncbi:MAG: MBL fold metallo-hydrolase [Solibacillus sp.]|uniref:MBL fold metallo-hydrolase n=1 Tax=unclassified Solibacillus TaxID=2637870 RepID=UPI0030FC3B31